ncbi:MAG: tyrosine-type recombinase/integrase [Micrococcus sp.]|nr:tyrosine-type recombinase/integrase [Micrococcus sp.]
MEAAPQRQGCVVIPRESPHPVGFTGDEGAALPPGLLDSLDRVNAALAVRTSPSTRRAYATDWARFTRWCASEERHAMPLPAHAFTVAAYLLDAAELDDEHGQARYSVTTLRRWLAAINQAHTSLGLPRPGADPRVGEVLQSVARTRASDGNGSQQRQAGALRGPDLRAIMDTLQPRAIMAGTWALRDAALLGLGYRCALRRSELAALRTGDIEPAPDGRWKVVLAASKTDQGGQGATLALTATDTALTCVPCALVRWVRLTTALDEAVLAATHQGQAPARAITQTYLATHPEWHEHICDQGMPTLTRAQRGGPLLRPIAPTGVPRARHMTGEAVHEVVRRRAATIGLDPAHYSGHSLRAGFVTDASAQGLPDQMIAVQTRHRSPQMIERYRRHYDPHSGNAEGHLS